MFSPADLTPPPHPPNNNPPIEQLKCSETKLQKFSSII